MGTDVSHGRNRTLRCLADEDRKAQQNSPFQTVRSEFTTQASGIPKAQERGVPRWLDFSNKVAVHEKNGMAGDIGSSGTISGVMNGVKVIALTRKRSGDYSEKTPVKSPFLCEPLRGNEAL
jgi:hypothetical protein